MSASLVGSEMCIRDRLRAMYPKGGPPLGEIGTGAAKQQSIVGASPPWSCLLYTSDAADDM
eukprot:1677763-Alexandrium_andersonii.AAC.1